MGAEIPDPPGPGVHQTGILQHYLVTGTGTIVPYQKFYSSTFCWIPGVALEEANLVYTCIHLLTNGVCVMYDIYVINALCRDPKEMTKVASSDIAVSVFRRDLNVIVLEKGSNLFIREILKIQKASREIRGNDPISG